MSPPLPSIRVIINSGVNHRKILLPNIYASDIPTYVAQFIVGLRNLAMHISIKDLIERKIYGIYT